MMLPKLPLTPPSIFVVYGCPFTAFELTHDLDAFVVPEPDRSLYHLQKNTNRVLSLLIYSRIKNVWLIGCSRAFVGEFTTLLSASYPARLQVRILPQSANRFKTEIVGNREGTHVIVVENDNSLLLIAHHLARYSGSKIVPIEALTAEEQNHFTAAQTDFEEGSGLRRENALNDCKSLIERKLGTEFLCCSCTSATFITAVPFNIYPFQYPTSHLPSPTAGQAIIAGILKTNMPQLQTGIAVILDSDRTQAGSASEFGPVSESLGLHCGILPGHLMADLGEFNHLIEYIPSDLIFLTAHCGHLPLKELRAVFLYKGERQEVQYAVNRGVSAVRHSGNVGLETQFLPVSVNGVAWKDRACDRQLFVKFAKIEIAASWGMKLEDSAFSEVKIEAVDSPRRILPAKGLGAGDGQYFVPLTTTIGNYHFPLVFNNACASYSGVCDEFLPESSFYIGTSRPVDSFSAVEVATKFASNLGVMSLGQALFEAQRPFINGFSPYLMAGIPWLSMPLCASSAVAIMKANETLKASIRHQGNLSGRDKATRQARFAHSRLLFQEQQRKELLKQLFKRT